MPFPMKLALTCVCATVMLLTGLLLQGWVQNVGSIVTGDLSFIPSWANPTDITFIPLKGPLDGILLWTGGSGFMIMVFGFTYRRSPFDLIPDCVPWIGEWDDKIFDRIGYVGLYTLSVTMMIAAPYEFVLHLDLLLQSLGPGGLLCVAGLVKAVFGVCFWIAPPITIIPDRMPIVGRIDDKIIANNCAIAAIVDVALGSYIMKQTPDMVFFGKFGNQMNATCEL